MTNYVRQHEPLWTPPSIPASYEARSLAMSSFKQHRKVATYTMGAGGVFLASPNANWIAQPPAAKPSGSPQVFADGRWGPLEWTRTPQLYQEATEHRIFIHRVDKVGMTDPAFVTPRDGHEFKTFDYASRKGRLRPDFLDSLLALRDSEELAAARAASDEVPNHPMLTRDEDADAALVRLSVDNRPLELTRIDVVTAQRRIIELRAFTAWATVKRAWNLNIIQAPLPVLPVVGTWLDFQQVIGRVLPRLTFLGIPCWYSAVSYSPPINTSPVDLSPYPADLSLTEWEDDVDHPTPRSHLSKRAAKRQAAIDRAREEGRDSEAEDLEASKDGPRSSGMLTPRQPPSHSPPPSRSPSRSRHLGSNRTPDYTSDRRPRRYEESGERTGRGTIRRTSPRRSRHEYERPGRPRHYERMRSRSRDRTGHRSSRPSSRERGRARREAGRSSSPYRRLDNREPRPTRQGRARSRPTRGEGRGRRSWSPRPSASTRREERGRRPPSPPPLASAYNQTVPRLAPPPSEQSGTSGAGGNEAAYEDGEIRQAMGEAIPPPQSERAPLWERFDEPVTLPETVPEEAVEADEAQPTQSADPLSYIPQAAFRADRPDRDVHRLRPILPRPRYLSDDCGHSCRTYLPIRSGAEVHYFLNDRFEDDQRFPGLFVPWADGTAETPYATPANCTPVPPGHLLVGSHTGLLRAVLWQWYSFRYINGVMTRDPEVDLSLWATPTQWRSRLRGGIEFRWRLGGRGSATANDALDALHLGTVTDAAARDYAWEVDTFLFRVDFERLTAFKHRGLNATPSNLRAAAWVPLRDRIRRIWGLDLNYFPSAREPAYLDSDDELLRLRHWRAMGRIMSEWEVTERQQERIQVAMGGTVTDIEKGLKDVFREVHELVYNRDPYPFEHRTDRIV